MFFEWTISEEEKAEINDLWLQGRQEEYEERLRGIREWKRFRALLISFFLLTIPTIVIIVVTVILLILRW